MTLIMLALPSPLMEVSMKHCHLSVTPQGAAPQDRTPTAPLHQTFVMASQLNSMPVQDLISTSQISLSQLLTTI
jgi:hypothetical protein